jgi:hypothetical protein
MEELQNETIQPPTKINTTSELINWSLSVAFVCLSVYIGGYLFTKGANAANR